MKLKFTIMKGLSMNNLFKNFLILLLGFTNFYMFLLLILSY
jgi:hypothetical protein